MVMCLTLSAVSAGASCNEDCKGEYLSALGQCRSNYETGDRNLQDLEDCLVDTRSEYDDCIDDCTALGANGVVACLPAASDSAAPPTIILGEGRDQAS